MKPQRFTRLNAQATAAIIPEKFTNQLFFAEGAHIPMHYRSIYSIKYVARGKLHYEIEQRNFDLTTGNYLVINNDRQVTCIPPQPIEKALSIFLEPQMINDIFWTIHSSNDQLLRDPFKNGKINPEFIEHVYVDQSCPLQQLLHDIFNKIDSEFGYINNDVEADFFIKLGETLVKSQQKHFSKLRHFDENLKHKTRVELYRRLLIAKAYMLDNLEQPIMLEEIAQVACMSMYHFHRTFSRVFGTSPMRYLRHKKMERAKELLSKRKFSVSDTAWSLGYTDIFGFSKAFKRETGRSPSSFCS